MVTNTFYCIIGIFSAFLLKNIRVNCSDFISESAGITKVSVNNTLRLLDEGSTVPFIARYRKEATGGLDEVEIAKIRDFQKKYQDIISRQQTISNAIEEQGKLSEELKEKINEISN